MAPYLQTVKSFADVSVTEAGVDTLHFLEAAQGVVGLFDILPGSVVFSAIQFDWRGNIATVRARYEAAPEKSATLEELVANEKGDNGHTATESLMWLIRGLAFTGEGLRNSQRNKEQELAAAFMESYEATLKQHHNIVVQGVLSVAIKACPNRTDLYQKLASDPEGGPATSQETLDYELNKWLAALDVIVKRVESFYATGNYSDGFSTLANVATIAGCAAGGAGLSVLLAPAAVGLLGFSAAGPVVGSIAAGIQASIGNVAAGSLFAGAQSVAMGGAIPAIGPIIGGAVTGALGWFGRR